MFYVVKFPSWDVYMRRIQGFQKCQAENAEIRFSLKYILSVFLLCKAYLLSH